MSAPTRQGTEPVLTGLVVLLVTVLGGPQVWDALRSGDVGLELLFYPVLAAAFGYHVVAGRRS